MIGHWGRSAEPISSKIFGLLVILLLLFPSSSSVLCIAPGNHIAIEDINALCCISPRTFLPSGSQPGRGLNGPIDCNNCTDIFLASNDDGVLSRSETLGAAGRFDAECIKTCFSADVSASLRTSGILGITDAPIPVCSSIPLRC
jgi:hypothetical protein